MKNYDLKSELKITKERLLDIPISEIPEEVNDIFKEYEDMICSREHSEYENTILMKLEYFRDDLESSNKLSINDIKDKFDEIINMIKE